MKKVNQCVPIETWKKIAYQIQRLKIKDFTDEEFNKNLKLLQKLLSENTEISLDLNERFPKNKDEIGLASLLQALYNNKNCHYPYIKSDFYEYIYALSDIGIRYMSFDPNGLDNISLSIHMSDPEKISRTKIYTDGSFQLEHKKYFGYNSIELKNLKNASYLIQIGLGYKSGITDIHCANAIVKKFNFDNRMFPSKKELMSIDFPELEVKPQTLKWGESPEYTESYYRFNLEELSCSKRLTKTRNGIYYYKEYKK